MKVVKLAYYDEFRCIGPECPYTCCKQWDIYFRKREYLDYKKVHCSSKLKEVISKSFVRVKDGNETRYAKIKFDENGYCPFLGSDRLCMVQKELGEGYLCSVCATFPRLHSHIGSEAFLFSCNVTCPYVVEILINHPEGLKITETEYDGKNKFINKGLYSNAPLKMNSRFYPYFWTLLNTQIDILQNRSFTISERLLILGFYSKKADDYINNAQADKLQALSTMLLDNSMCKKITDSLKAPQSEEAAAAKSIDVFLKMLKIAQNPKNSESLRKMFFDVADSIDFSSKQTEGNKVEVNYNAEKYLANVNLYRKIEAERPYIIENLFVNLLFEEIPINGMWDQFFTLALFYNNLKMWIPAFLKENWSDRDLAKAITYSAIMMLNSHIASTEGLDFMDHNSFDLPHAAFLIS